MNGRNQITLVFLALGALAAGCDRAKPAPKAPPPAPVVVTNATVSDVPVYRDYPGTLMSVRTVEINGRVEGWLLKQAFQDGQMVEPGQLLYMIDPTPFQVALDQARADKAVADANLANAWQKYDRNKPLVKVEAVSQEDFDTMEASWQAAEAQVKAKKAAVEQAELNLSYCTILSPAKGQISKTLVYEGTLVVPGSTSAKLNNIRQLDPIWAQFTPVSEDIPALRKLLTDAGATTQVSLPTGSWKRDGKIVFVDNSVGSSTSTITARVELPNSDLALVPGTYVSVRLNVGLQKGAVSVPATAIVYETAQALVWVVDANDTVSSKPVTLGSDGGAGVVVLSGLTGNERVVVQGQQKLKGGAKVTITQPTKGSGAAAAATSGTPAASGTPATSGTPAAKPAPTGSSK